MVCHRYKHRIHSLECHESVGLEYQSHFLVDVSQIYSKGHLCSNQSACLNNQVELHKFYMDSKSKAMVKPSYTLLLEVFREFELTISVNQNSDSYVSLLQELFL